MLKIKIGKAFAFLPYTNIDPDQALLELMGDIDPTQLIVSEEMLQSLFGEWLLFDYKPKSGGTLIEQYYFRDPDNLSRTELDELQQIIETQSVHLLQTYAVSQPPFVYLHSVLTNKKFKVYDRAMSQSAGNLQGSFLGRIARVGTTYYLVGSNPVGFPIRHTQRAIQIFAKEKTPAPSLKDSIGFLIKPDRQEPKKVNLKQERGKLEIRFKKLAATHHAKVSFRDIVAFIHEEQYDHNIADFITDLINIGVPELMCIENIDLFLAMWNYFPHKQLGGKCPHELSD